MNIDTLKPLLIVLVLGIAGMLLITFSDADSTNPISAAFARLVAECQTAHPDWTEETCQRIVRNEVWLGMTDEMVVASIGEPRRVLEPRSDDQPFVEWFYSTSRYGEETFRFEDGILVAVISGDDCTTCGINLDRDVDKK